MDCQHIGAGNQPVQVGRDVDPLGNNRLLQRLAGSGQGIEPGLSRRVSRSDRHAVQVGDKAVVVVDIERQ